MGITPITNLMPLPVARLEQGEMEPSPMERVQGSSRTRDETYSPSGGQSALSSDEDASGDGNIEDSPGGTDDESADRQISQSIQTAVPRKISFFA
jgi:hypothetical protein